MMELEIIRPLSKQEFSIAWIELNTSHGNFVIQPDHSPMVLVLSPKSSCTFCLSNGKQELIEVERAVAEITRKKITLLVSQ